MKESNSFERLVSTISQDERKSLLKKLKTSDNIEEQKFAPETEVDSKADTIKELFEKENIFLKFFLYLKSLFTSENIDFLYNEVLIRDKARFVEKNYSNLLNYKDKKFTAGLFNQIQELALVSKYFKRFINFYEDNRNQFYISLSSIIVPDLAKRMDLEANPYNSQLKPEETIERRSSYSKKVDEIINDISVEEKHSILVAIRAVEWLSAFSDLPFDSILYKFNSDSSSTQKVSFENIRKELSLFAKVLSTNTSFPLELFEVFYISGKNKENENSPSLNLNQEEEMKAFLEKSTEQIQLIKMYTQSVPSIDITRIAYASILWKPEELEKTDTWLSQLKSYWKKLFDDTWEKWLLSVKKNILIEKMKSLIGATDLPELPYKPWVNIDSLFYFQFDQSLSFLFAFFKISYPKYAKVLKEILINGDFIQRDNKTEFTDTYNAFDQIEQSIYLLNDKLSFKGSYGTSFVQLQQEALITVQGQAKLKSLIHSLESEIKTLVVHFADSCRSMSSLTGGILHEEKNIRYASLKNFTEIWGNKNVEFRNELHDARQVFLEALEIIKELDSLSLLETRVNN